MTKYILGAALVAILSLAGALYWQAGRVAKLQEVNASLSRSITALEVAKAQAQAAATIARKEAARQQAKAAEYEQVKDAFRTGDFNAPLPADFRVLLNRVLRKAAD